ncbi:MAG TPA: hypothetical protein VIV57_14170, partial [Anaeromyxobacter sp.]
LLVQSVREGLHAHVARLRQEKPPSGDVAAGRRWVAAYVPFVHWAEGVYRTASGAAGDHGAGPGSAHGGGPPEHGGAAEEPAGRESAEGTARPHAH